MARNQHPMFTTADHPVCEACGYALGGLPDHGNCPECGASYDPETRGVKLNPPTFRRAIGFAIKPLAIGAAAAIVFVALAAVHAGQQSNDPAPAILLLGTAFFALGLGACWTGLRGITLLRALARFAERGSNRPAVPALLGWVGTAALGAFALVGALLTVAMTVAFAACLVNGRG